MLNCSLVLTCPLPCLHVSPEFTCITYRCAYQTQIYGQDKSNPEHMVYIRWLAHCEIGCLSSLFVILWFLRKLGLLLQSFVWLNAAVRTDAVFYFRHVYLHRQICAFLFLRVCNTERRVDKCLRKCVYAYIFNLGQMHTLLNLAAVCDCLVLLDECGRVQSLLRGDTVDSFIKSKTQGLEAQYIFCSSLLFIWTVFGLICQSTSHKTRLTCLTKTTHRCTGMFLHYFEHGHWSLLLVKRSHQRCIHLQHKTVPNKCSIYLCQSFTKLLFFFFQNWNYIFVFILKSLCLH